jgi:hypothetical protein
VAEVVDLPFRVRRITIDPTIFTAVSPPMDCKRMVLSRGSENDNFWVGSDQNDMNQAKEVAAGFTQEFRGESCMYMKDRTACYVKAKSQVGVLVVEAYR